MTDFDKAIYLYRYLRKTKYRKHLYFHKWVKSYILDNWTFYLYRYRYELIGKHEYYIGVCIKKHYKWTFNHRKILNNFLKSVKQNF